MLSPDVERERSHQPDHSHVDAQKQARVRQMVEMGFQSLVEELKQGKSERFMRYLDFCARFQQYSPYNQMLIFMQRPSAAVVRERKSWEHLGYRVRESEQGILIVAPIVQKRPLKNGREEWVVVGFGIGEVYAESQLDTASALFTLPSRCPWPHHYEENIYLMAKQAVERSGIRVEEAELRPGLAGKSVFGEIVLSEADSALERTGTLMHEWAHEIMHWDYRDGKPPGGVSVELRDYQADWAAYIVCHYLRIGFSPYTWTRRVLSGDEAVNLVSELFRVQEAASTMIDRLEEMVGKSRRE